LHPRYSVNGFPSPTHQHEKAAHCKVRYYLNGNTWANPYGRLIQSTHFLFTSPCEDHFSRANLKLQTGFSFPSILYHSDSGELHGISFNDFVM
jgi:hypothetical protein